MSLDIRLYIGNECVFDRNITHNLQKMAEEAGLEYAMWYPHTYDVRFAGELVPYIVAGVLNLRNDPTYYQKFNAVNGWGSLHNLVEVASAYAEACIKYQHARVEVSG